jgi:hypothetical protein
MSFLRCDDIVTPRLTLIGITPEMLLSEKNGDGRLGVFNGEGEEAGSIRYRLMLRSLG